MTLIAEPTNPTVITIVLRDENGVELNKEFYVPTSVWNPATGLIADLKTIRDNLVTAYAAIFDGLIYRAFISLRQIDDTATLGPANSDFTQAASVVVNLSTAGKTATIEIPAPDIGIFTGATPPNSNQIDKADTALLAFTELYSVTDGTFTISDGEQVTDTSAEQVKGGKRISKKVKLPTT